MSCPSHPQVMDPCADDSVSVGQALGAQGDVSFAEYGETLLSVGDTEKEVTFDYQKESNLYRFPELYVESGDETANNIIPVVIRSAKTTRKFKVKFSGSPTDNNSVLVWRVKIPDPLRVICAGNGPQYAIIPTERHGVKSLVSGQTFVAVTFEEAMPVDWGFEMLSVRKAFNEANTLGFVFTEIVHSLTGFTLDMSGAPDNGDYTLHWQVRGFTA